MALPFQVGITGGIGSGKSTVAKVFSALGVPVYDADSRAKFLMSTDLMLIDQIKREFGEAAYADGQLNRKYLAAQVFGNPEQLKKLNGFVHPRVAEDYSTWVKSHANKKYVLKEAALLFETGSAAQLDAVIVVTAREDVRVKRVMQRDGRTEEEVMKIIREQWPQEKLLSQAQYEVKNDETIAVVPQVMSLHTQFTR